MYARRLAAGLAAAGLSAVAVKSSGVFGSPALADADNSVYAEIPLLTRAEQLKNLKGSAKEPFDVLVIGGGATGAGVALDAATRGLRTALVDRDDFSSGTSSRSTKLIHGGVRYLQKAIMNFDYEQYLMVKEALHERSNLLGIAPHLSYPLPIMLPVYKWWQLPYFWVGIKMYDFVAGSKNVKSSYVLGKSKALEAFPMLKQDDLVGAIVYYDGQHNDARMNLTIAITAAVEGATIANHCEVTRLLKRKDESTGKEVVAGATVRDVMTGETWDVHAKSVINATGPFTDAIRRMDDASAPKMVQPSAGVHIVLPDYYSPRGMGLLDPATSDGRVIFFLPWQNTTIAGTTDSPTEVTALPRPREEEIHFILEEIRHYLNPDVQVRRGDVLAAWSGIRPLVSDPNSKDTQSIVRNHIVHVSASNLVTIAGGKWTTYRSMAVEAVDAAVKAAGLKPLRPSQTDGKLLLGGAGWSPTLFIRLVQDFGIDVDVAQHLSETYGTRAFEVAKLAQITGKRWPVVGNRLIAEYPYIEAEVVYAIKEYACTAVDVLARRTRLAFINVQAAEEALPRIVKIMAQHLRWDKRRQEAEIAEAKEFLLTMGTEAREKVRVVPINFTEEETRRYRRAFSAFDLKGNGHISALELRAVLDSIGEEVSEDHLRDLIAEVDINKNSTIELDEFLQLMSALKTGAVANNRLATIIEKHAKYLERGISVDRSGGGV